jgi:hypothetical protein
MQNRNNFQILRRNEDNTLRIEYLQTVYTDITFPIDETGNELRGSSLNAAVNQVVLDIESKPTIDPKNDKDPNIDAELQVI